MAADALRQIVAAISREEMIFKRVFRAIMNQPPGEESGVLSLLCATLKSRCRMPMRARSAEMKGSLQQSDLEKEEQQE